MGADRRTPPRGRVSPRRYMVRRLGALVVLAVALIGVIRVSGALFGGGKTSEAAGPEAASGVGIAGTAGTAGTVATSIAVTTTEVPAPTTSVAKVPSAATPALLLIVGDSDAGTFGPYLQTLLDQTGVVRTTLDYKVSSGLARPDFFDWPDHFRATIPQAVPDIVVVTFGGNDGQGLTEASGNFIVGQPTGDGDEKWRAEYGRRVGEVMDYLSSEGRTMLWVGIPNDDNPDVTLRMSVQNEVVQAEAAQRPGVVFIDTWRRFSGRDGNWAEYVIDPRDGQGKDVRASDGFHLNETGAEILALDIAEAIRAELRARGATF